MNSSLRIALRESGRPHGEVFTGHEIIAYLLDEVGYMESRDLSKTSILEPSAGKGDIALGIIRRLYSSACTYGFDFMEALLANVRLVELDPSNFEKLDREISAVVEALCPESDFDMSVIATCADFLSLPIQKRFDCVVANPPYIRHELLSEKQKAAYRLDFRTFTHRADLYIPFFERSLRLLNPGGTISFVCSNRWIYNQYGKELRRLIATKFHLQKLLNIERTSPFDENVIAYPAIVTISDQPQNNGTLFLDFQDKVIDWKALAFQLKPSPKDHSWEHLFVSYALEDASLQGIIEQGFDIGIGIATGADSVFLLKEGQLQDIEPECLIPILLTQDLRKDVIDWSGHYLVNPFGGLELRNLDAYPGLKTYFHLHKDKLQNRYVSKNSPSQWYKTIDKVKPTLQSQAKLLLPDISGMKFFHIDEGRFYPHHNLYYITSPNANDAEDLVLLACILMSDFARNQVLSIGLKMNGGVPRYQSQILKKLRVPIIANLNEVEKSTLKLAYQNRDHTKINQAISAYLARVPLAKMQR